MVEVSEQLRDGDIFRWRYKKAGDDGQYGRYHCCSCIAVVKDGRLYDTYWYGGDNKSFGLDDLSNLELTRLANFADLERHPEWQADYYDDADIVNLNHANSSSDNFYLRKGAKRSAKKMLETARYRLERAESKKQSAEWDMERLVKAIAKIESGETSGVFI